MNATSRSSPSVAEPGARRPTGDPRAQRSRHIVLATAVELLQAKGVGGFSVDELARRSGVAKTTIYRHWPTRETLILDACAKLDTTQVIPDTGSLAGDLHAYLTALADLLQRANWAVILPSIVDAAERDGEFATVHADIQRGHAAPVRQIVQHAIARGELPDGTDPAVIAAVVLGPLYYRRWFSREPLDTAFIDAVVGCAIATAGQPAAGER